VPAEMTK